MKSTRNDNKYSTNMQHTETESTLLQNFHLIFLYVCVCSSTSRRITLILLTSLMSRVEQREKNKEENFCKLEKQRH